MTHDLDPYAVLGLDAGASALEIRQAFRRLALQHHPDRQGGAPAAEETLKRITAAYHRLKQAGVRVATARRTARSAYEAPTEPIVWPTHWSDGAPIHYPTPAELASLLNDVGAGDARRRYDATARSVAKLAAQLAAGVIAVGLLWLAVVAVYRVMDALGFFRAFALRR